MEVSDEYIEVDLFYVWFSVLRILEVFFKFYLMLWVLLDILYVYMEENDGYVKIDIFREGLYVLFF